MKQKPTKKFECDQKGDCCRDFNVTIDPWKEGGVVHMVKDGSVGVEVWPWEARELIMRSAGKEENVVVMPSNLMLDRSRNIAVAISYFIANDACPMQNGNRCSIHDTKPNVCHYFPLVMGRPGIRISERCPMPVKPRKAKGAKANLIALREFFGNGVDYLLMDIHAHEYVMDLVGTMELKGFAKWDLDPNIDVVFNMVQGTQWSDFLEYMIFIGFLTPEKVQKFIQEVTDLEDIEKKVDLRLLPL